MAGEYTYDLPYEAVDGPVVVPDYYVPPAEEADTADPITREGYVWNVFWARWDPIPDPTPVNRVSAISTTLTVLQAGDPIPYVYGRTTIKPKIITAHAADGYLYVDYLVSKGECNNIISLTQGGTDIGKPSTDFEYFTGASGQAASTMMEGVLGSYDTLDGICHFVAKLSASDSMDFDVLVEGIKTFDPRLSPQANAYSANPALALAHVLTECGYTIDYTSLATAANYCDESVSGSNRWEIHLPIENRSNIRNWIQALQQYAHCYVDIIAGEATFIVDAPVTTSPSISRVVTAADMVAGSAKTKKVGTKDVPLQMTVMYREEDGTQRAAVAGSGSAGERTRLNLPGFKTFTMAKRHGVEGLAKAQADLRHEHIAHDTALSDSVGDLHAITYAPHGLSGKVMRLVALTETDRGRWKREYVEYNGSAEDNNEYTTPVTSDTNLPSAQVVPDGPTPTLTESLQPNVYTGALTSMMTITFTGVNWIYADEYYITIERDGVIVDTQNIAHRGVVTHTTTYWPLVFGVTYTVKVYVRATWGQKSATPGQASLTSSLATTAELNEGELTNMHVYTLDGDGRYATTSPKSGSPETGVTWAERFTDSPQGGTAWSAGETWLGNQTCETVFETEIWDSGDAWYGKWFWIDYGYVTELGGASSGDYVSLSGETSPISFTDYTGTAKTDTARYMKAKSVVSDSPLAAGYGLHVKLPITVNFQLGG